MLEYVLLEIVGENMDDFDFSLYQEIGILGADYVKKYNITLPLRIYNTIRNIRFISFDVFFEQLTILLNSHTSQYLFSGNICFFYPGIRNPKASYPTTCHFSGAKIAKGESYLYYRPILENITRGKSIQSNKH